MILDRGIADLGIAERGIATRGLAGIGAMFNPLSLDPSQWLYDFSSPTTILDKTANVLDVDIVESPCLTFAEDTDSVITPVNIYEVLQGKDWSLSVTVNTGDTDNSYLFAAQTSGSNRFYLRIGTTPTSLVVGVGSWNVVYENALVTNEWQTISLSMSGTTGSLRNGDTLIGSVQNILLEYPSIELQFFTHGKGYNIFEGSACCFTLDADGSSIASYRILEKSGTTIHDVSGNGNDGTLTTTSESLAWANTQDVRAYAAEYGFSLYEHATLNPLYVPYGIDGNPLTITPPTGYTKTSDNPALDNALHNNGPYKIKQKSTNTDFLDNAFWSADGINYDAKSFAELREHLNFENNVIICSTASSIVAGWTWAQSKTWTPDEYTKFLAYLSKQGCDGSSLVPAEVLAGTGIGPDSDWYDAGDGTLLFVEL